MTIIGPAQAVTRLMEGRDILVDGVRYRLRDGRVRAVVGGREFQSAIKLESLLYGVLDDDPDRHPPWDDLHLVEVKMDALDTDVHLLLAIAGDDGMPETVRDAARRLASAWTDFDAAVRGARL